MTFDPFDHAPVTRKPDHGRVAYAGDTRHPVGNITARARRAGTPATLAEWRSLMRAPAGR